MGKIVYLMGKSSSGKDTVFKELMKEGTMDLRTIVPYTTRPIRAGEENGVEYFFTDETGFQTLREQGKVIEDRAYNTVYGIWRYFTVDDGQIDLTTKNYFMIGTLEAYEKMIAYRNDVNLFVDYDSMFHMQVSAATHNKLLISTMIAAKESFEKGIRLAMRESLTQNPRVIDVTIELHGKILEAIKNGDYQTAYSAMREHISYVNLTVKYG